jgi:hypothetical protein
MKTVIQLPVILSMIFSFPTSGYANPDNIKPSCEATFVGVNTNDEKFAQFTAHDNTSLFKTTVTEMVNSTTTVYVPEDDKIVVFIATKIDQTQKAIINAKVSDKAGNVSDCIDAISINITDNGNSVDKIYPNIPHKTGGQVIVHVKNGAAGIDELSIVVNGTEYLTTFSDGEYKQIDISSSMQVGNNNNISFTGSGNPDGSAAAIIFEY